MTKTGTGKYERLLERCQGLAAMAKQLTFLANADCAGLVLGARMPVILTSRADSLRARIASCAAAVLVAHARRQPSSGARDEPWTTTLWC